VILFFCATLYLALVATGCPVKAVNGEGVATERTDGAVRDTSAYSSRDHIRKEEEGATIGPRGASRGSIWTACVHQEISPSDE